MLVGYNQEDKDPKLGPAFPRLETNHRIGPLGDVGRRRIAAGLRVAPDGLLRWIGWVHVQGNRG